MREIFLIWFQLQNLRKNPKNWKVFHSKNFSPWLCRTWIMRTYGISMASGSFQAGFQHTWDQQSQFNVITVFCNTNCWISHSITFIPSTFFSFSDQTFRYVLTGPRHLASFALLPKTQEVRRQFEMQQTLGRLKGWFWGLRKLFFCLCQECKFTRLAMLVMSLSISYTKTCLLLDISKFIDLTK